MFFANYKRSDYRTEGRVRNNIAQRYPIANPRDQLSGGTAILVSRQTSVVTKEQSASFGAIKIGKKKRSMRLSTKFRIHGIPPKKERKRRQKSGKEFLRIRSD
ncbi:uncharacterized protein LOC105695252 isoform X2 [Orussus abietinus]|uniref:uncharacterized protein LOC105695252 isoform X2 n=1 Tax=Orussus abietinus TaxID=222816 RepID=UPI000625B2E1|nr:uncharacterized protein LOC105695252 isoform X2 [Orussus abietinus]